MAETKKKKSTQKTGAKKTSTKKETTAVKKIVKVVKKLTVTKAQPKKRTKVTISSPKGKTAVAAKTSTSRSASPRATSKRVRRVKKSVTSTEAPVKAVVPAKNEPKAVMPAPTFETALTEVKPEPVKTETSTRKDNAYNPQSMEQKWQAQWEADKLYRAVID